MSKKENHKKSSSLVPIQGEIWLEFKKQCKNEGINEITKLELMIEDEILCNFINNNFP
ncbi:MAG: hypothetical protein ACFFCS_27535 [Candidatus Hodarchaeota archaeon]